jgi:hypothetical protein
VRSCEKDHLAGSFIPIQLEIIILIRLEMSGCGHVLHVMKQKLSLARVCAAGFAWMVHRSTA